MLFFLVPCFSLCCVWLMEMILLSLLICLPMHMMYWSSFKLGSLSIAVDKVGLMLVALTLWVVVLLLSSLSCTPPPTPPLSIISFLSLFLMGVLILLFSSSNLISFFLLFELSLVPTLGIIAGWGPQPERISALVSFFFFTSCPSTLMFLALVQGYSVPLYVFMDQGWTPMCTGSFSLFVVMALFSKLPVMFLHFWLPKAHVEAPAPGSMILAGVLLKMGGFGLARLQDMISLGSHVLWIQSVAFLGSIIVSMYCLFLPDMKMIIAFSSVSHMNFLILGLLTWKSLSLSGSTLLMVSHGVVSSGLFYLVNCFYSRSGSRSALFSGGFFSTSLSLCFWWILTCILNMAFPPSLGFLSEFLLSSSLISSMTVAQSLLILYFLLSAIYSFILLCLVCYGATSGNMSFYPLTTLENSICFFHIVPMVILLFMVDLF
nr:NADH dehydrogenase subunit 4 [Austromenopon atrofulvum]